jgi:Phage portal protein
LQSHKRLNECTIYVNLQNWGRIFTNLWRPEKWGRSWFYRFNSTAPTWNEIDVLDAFNTVPELNAAINMKARAHSNGIYKHVDQDGNEIDDDLNRTLKTPNWFQAQKEWIRQSVLFHEIWGNEFQFLYYPVGMPQKVSRIFTLPPNFITVEYRENIPFFLFKDAPKNVKYCLTYDHTEKELDTDQIIHLNDNRVTVKTPIDKEILTGESKYAALRAVINNIKAAYESRGVILKYRGALGILSNAGKDGTGSPLPVDPIERERLQNEYRKYGGLEDQFQIIISDSNLKWQQMGVNPDRLGLFEEIEKDFDKILDAAGIPPELFASKEGSTFENQKQAEKGLYLRTIIPEANERAAAMTAKLLPNTTDRIAVDFSHLPMFQDDLGQRGASLKVVVEALSKAFQDGAITIEQYQAELIKYGIEQL